jgi:hypothetical protein
VEGFGGEEMSTLSPSVSEDHGGEHICLPFETDSEKRDAVVAFIHEGLSRGARCIYTGTADEFENLKSDLETLGICSRRAVQRDALSYRSMEEAYLSAGKFDPPELLKRTQTLIDEALANGFTGLRRTGELGNAPDEETWNKIVWYEARVNEHFARRPFWALCRYSRSAVSSDHVNDLLRSHPFAIVRGEKCENPFYERPELALSNDSETRLNWRLRQLLEQSRTKRYLEGKTAAAVAAATELAIELSALRAGDPRQTK